MKYDPQRHHRRSIRLRGYDYAQPGAYFVTVVAQQRACLFGDVVDCKMRLNDAGRVVAQTWAWLAQQYEYVELDAWVVMPNHLHGIIVIRDDIGMENGGGSQNVGDDDVRGGSRTAPTTTPRTIPTTPETPTVTETTPPKRKTIGRLVGAFKTVSTKHINQLRGTPGVAVWQRNYYEHIIRNQAALERIRAYIAHNPHRWESDRENLHHP